MHVALLGCGYWGGEVLLPKLINNAMFDKITVLANSYNRRDKILEKSDKVFFTINENDVFKNNSIKHLFIALPAAQHYAFAKKGIINGKDIFIEKPMATSYEQAMELNLLAEALGCTIMVDHTFLYTRQLQTVKNIISSGCLGDIKYYDSTRASLGNVQKDVNVLWDLAIHDLAILYYLIEEDPVSVNAVGSGLIFDDIVSDARVTLFYKSAFTANIKVSWNFPEKIRDIFIGGTEKMIKYDDASLDEKVKLYDCGYSIGSDNRIIYKRNGYTTVDTGTMDALVAAVEEFINCCENHNSPLSSGIKAAKYINILEKIDHSIRNKGKEVKI